jgi:hypothetical protein
MATRAGGRATRPKKLNAKQSVQIFRESQIESLADYDTQRTAIETGVEKAEESVCPPICTITHLHLAFLVVLSSMPLSHPPLGFALSDCFTIGVPSPTSHQSI